jgi:hypothetical protein
MNAMDYAQSSAWAETNPILSSPRSNAPEPRNEKKPVPAAIKRMILELGVRYRPASSAMLEGHNATVAALIADVADMPPHLLERAIADHVRESNFMPKAAQLIAKCRALLTPAKPDSDKAARWRRRVNEGNRMLIRDQIIGAHWALGAGGMGCELRTGPMPREAHDQAMTIDPAVLPDKAA